MSTGTQSSDFAIRTEKLDNATVVALTGELDIAETPNLIVELRHVLARDRGPVILDVRELTYIDSSALAVIASTRAALRREKRNMAAVGCHGIFEKILHITQLDREVACFASVEDAIEAAR
ncbi:MAG: STAS domain-containing protein [Armatimonadota bacterium]|nr:STAS domain-containing protein [Armatimonadota bacterium]